MIGSVILQWQLIFILGVFNFPSFCALHCRYDSFTDSSRNEMKRKFALTMEFVEEYLKEVVNQPFPFGDKEKNKLTFEVLLSYLLPNLRYFSFQLDECWLFQNKGTCRVMVPIRP